MASSEQLQNGPPAGLAGSTSSLQQQQQGNNFEPIDKNLSSTLKRNPKMELSKTDLLKLLSYLEGELQARDVIIAALKSEKIRHLLNSKYKNGATDPHSAFARDQAIVGGLSNSSEPVEQQVATLEALVTQQRRMQCHMANILKEAEFRHRIVVKELEEEKQKNEIIQTFTHETDIDKANVIKDQNLENEGGNNLAEKEKKLSEILEEEKNRHKQIVLTLLAERKKIIMKYVEERKRSEDLAQILSEEKIKLNETSESLEEESKKALQMEAELEKQLAQFDIERQQYKQALLKEEKKNQELHSELERLRSEIEIWKDSKSNTIKSMSAIPPLPPAKPANLTAMPTLRATGTPAVLGAGTPMVSSKVVQPTATVSSVPVSGPTTGIARSVTPGQGLRNVGYTSSGAQQTANESVLPQDSQGLLKRSLSVTGAVGIGPNPTVKPGQPGQGASIVPGPGTNPVLAAGVTSTMKPAIRGNPPPVPPNKPVVPPKKEGTAVAFLRRSESATDPPKFVKQQTVIANPAAATIINQQTISAGGGSTDDEAKPR